MESLLVDDRVRLEILISFVFPSKTRTSTPEARRMAPTKQLLLRLKSSGFSLNAIRTLPLPGAASSHTRWHWCTTRDLCFILPFETVSW